METRILPVDAGRIGRVAALPSPGDVLDRLDFILDDHSPDAKHLREAAEKLRQSDIPVAFPTETVYGLGADATRSSAVRGIYKAKQRPSDNPLIIHFASLSQLRSLLRGQPPSSSHGPEQDGNLDDPIPDIYKPLISRFWPGPLTILLPNPPHSPLAPEVTAGLKTFGARMPRHILALALIHLADVPIAAPSANASTKPSPTAAEHVAYDLHGRIETIIDGGPCDVGVESTVVDGLSNPPSILRPGGISLEQIRSCPGWEATEIGYQNIAEAGTTPKAPGMKYRHYSPKATVVLVESSRGAPSATELHQQVGSGRRLGLIRTKLWGIRPSDPEPITQRGAIQSLESPKAVHFAGSHMTLGFSGMLQSLQASSKATSPLQKYDIELRGSTIQVLDIRLGSNVADIARGVFSALRDLDKENVDAIFVEGIDDDEGDTAAAVMNRLRKAAEIRVQD